MDLLEMEAVRSWPRPTMATEVKGLALITSALYHCLPTLHTLYTSSLPLHNLPGHKNPKLALTNSPVLAYPDVKCHICA